MTLIIITAALAFAGVIIGAGVFLLGYTMGSR